MAITSIPKPLQVNHDLSTEGAMRTCGLLAAISMVDLGPGLDLLWRRVVLDRKLFWILQCSRHTVHEDPRE
jgi:hypothetical protein